MCCCRLCFFFYINGKQLSLIAQHSNFFHLSLLHLEYMVHISFFSKYKSDCGLYLEKETPKIFFSINFFEEKKKQSYQGTMSHHDFGVHLINSNNKANPQNNDFCPIIVLRDTCLNILHLFAVYIMSAFLYIERDRNTNSIQTTRYSLISHE